MALEVVHGSFGTERTRGPAGHPRASGRTGALRALVVDDEPSICQAMSIILGRAGYEVVAARSGDAALATIRAEQVDVMLIDLRIPDMRGDIVFELAAAIQPHLAYQTLFMTGDITDSAELLIGACRCNYLRKPFNMNDLVDAIAAIAPRAVDQTA